MLASRGPGAHAAGVEHPYQQSLASLEDSVRVPREQQVETQEVDPPRDYLAPEDLARTRLVASPEGPGG